MKGWQDTLITLNHSIRAVIQSIDKSGLQIALVVNDQRQLLGTVTDGDIRRAILKGFSLEDSVAQIMNSQPIAVTTTTSHTEILGIMRRKVLRQIPVIDRAGIVVDLALLDALLEATQRHNWVVLMAGGLGSRLAPLTNDCPKPLLKVGGKPILENILESFINEGFHKFFISVNYKSHMIEEYFGNGSHWGVDICYLREQQRLGTAGGLGLLPERPQQPMFVMNGDLLTKVSFLTMLNFHQEHQSVATMAVREYDFQIPFGVVQTDRNRITDIIEKPLYKFHVNAGIYLLEPSCLDLIPSQEYYDMPNLFKTLAQQQEIVMPFPTSEYWLDVGRIDDFERANVEFCEVFA
ncbi:UTP--glucose-1-phosphate uridylyltransferase [Tumidithrix helvetica PCC 7403]|uniref:nucleotidyltransferase family protein n=1 Tax=Tumidithrix helvetica TaxID=3457545 RepID=UPI003CA28610